MATLIRHADLGDAQGFHSLAARYIAESGQGRAYSAPATSQAFDWLVGDAGSALLLADGQGELAGGAIVQIDRAFTEKPVGIITMFYVAPDYRGTGLARELLSSSVDWAREQGISHLFCSASAELPGDETQKFVNLCRRFGFTPGGPVLSRKMQ
jgi:GNAT superfamily N-acetyltransferase